MKWWPQRAERWSEELREEAREHIGDGANVRTLALVGAFIVFGLFALSIYWSREPAPFDVATSVDKVLRESIAQPSEGAITTATLVQIMATLLDKPGGFLNNDIAPPGVWLDDMPSWERGVLQQARAMTRSLLDDFSRSDVTAEADEDLARAEPRINFSDNSWMLPSSESQYRDAHNYLRAYLLRLQNLSEPAAQFIATPAALERYLARVTEHLDVSVQALSACVASNENPQLRSTAIEIPTRPITPSNKIDDVFYEARGSAWALLHLLRAIDVDFAAVLREKNAQNSLREAIRALDAAQGRIYSPMILNGSGFGLVANHSLVMASYMARADSALAAVRRQLVENAPAPKND